MLSKGFLDLYHRKVFEEILVAEGLASRSLVEGDPLDKGVFFRSAPPENIRRKVLRNAVLFEELDSDYTHVDMEKLVELEVISENSSMISTGSELSGGIRPETSEEEELYTASRNLAVDLIERSFPSICRWYLSHVTDIEYDSNVLSNLAVNRMYETLTSFREHAVTGFRETGETRMEYWSDPSSQFISFLNNLYWNYKDILFLCGANQTTILAEFADFRGPRIRSEDVIDHVYYVARTKLHDELLILPSPEDFKDVIELRRSPHIKRFREVLGVWEQSLIDGNFDIEKKMRRDVALANQSLKAVGKWREYKDSPINFWITSVGGHVPVLSNIITASHTIGDLGSWWLERRFGWRALCDPNM